MFGKYTYLILDLFALAPILFLSFDGWVKYYKKWGISLLSLFPVAVFFIIWDIWFTKIGIWEFNPEFLIGIDIVNLPIEEWSFFLVIPWVCLFIHEVIRVHFWKFISKINMSWMYYVLLIAVVFGFFYGNGLYTRINFGLSVITLLLHILLWNKTQKTLFGFTYLLHILPFALVNGILTSEPVVIYNNLENLSIRIGTIPIEDFMYSYNLIGLTFLIFYPLDKNIKN